MEACLNHFHIMLVSSDQAASAFLLVELRRLAPRGHKSILPQRHKAPFVQARHMLVGADQAASAFLLVQLRWLEARGHFRSIS
jgi:hypothetical protein